MVDRHGLLAERSLFSRKPFVKRSKIDREFGASRWEMVELFSCCEVVAMTRSSGRAKLEQVESQEVAAQTDANS